MTLYKLEPATHEADPRWMGRPIFSLVLVRAATAGRARLLADAFERTLDPRAALGPVGNESQRLGTALADEKLYHMHPVQDEKTLLAALAADLNDPETDEGVLFARRAEVTLP